MNGRRRLSSRPLLAAVVALTLGLPARLAQPSSQLNAEGAKMGGLAVVTYLFGADIGNLPQAPCSVRPVPLWLDSGRFPQYPPSGMMAGILRAGGDLRTVVAGPFLMEAETLSPTSFYLARCSRPDWYRCDFFPIIVGESLFYGIELMPDDDTLLVAYAKDDPLGPQPPFGVAKYRLRDMRPTDPCFDGRSRYRLAPPVGGFETEQAVWDIRRDPDGKRAYLLAMEPGGAMQRSEGFSRHFTLYTIDVDTMAEIAPRLEVPPIRSEPSKTGGGWMGWSFNPHLAISPDGRWLLILTGARRPDSAPVVDLAERRLSTLRLGSAAFFAIDASFSAGPAHRGLLALALGELADVRRLPEVWLVVGRLDASGFTELGRTFVGPSFMGFENSPVAWAAGGESVVIVYGGNGPPELGWPRLAVYAIGEGGQSVTLARAYPRPCWGDYGDPTRAVSFPWYGPISLLTENGYLPTLMPTPTASPSPTRPLSTATPEPTASATPTSGATFTASPPPRRPAWPAYLPLVLREECPVKRQYADIALVVDASTTMRDHLTAAGRPKLQAAIEATNALLDLLSLPRDRAAVVIFNADAQVLQPLSGDRAALQAALDSIPDRVRLQTRIHRGLEVAQMELTGSHHRRTNRPVLILLTDGLANPEPVSLALNRADEAKAAGITLFTIGLGQPAELNFEELRQMASRPEYFFHAPDGEDLLAIYRAIALELPCPGARFWGGR